MHHLINEILKSHTQLRPLTTQHCYVIVSISIIAHLILSTTGLNITEQRVSTDYNMARRESDIHTGISMRDGGSFSGADTGRDQPQRLPSVLEPFPTEQEVNRRARSVVNPDIDGRPLIRRGIPSDFTPEERNIAASYDAQAAQLPGVLETVLASPHAVWSGERGPDPDKFGQTLRVASLQTTDAPVLDSSWKLLDKKIHDPSLPSDQRRAAALVADALAEQTTRSPERKIHGVQDVPNTSTLQDHNNAVVLVTGHPAGSRKIGEGWTARRALKNAVDAEPLREYVRTVGSLDTDHQTVRDQITAMDGLIRFKHGSLGEVCAELSDGKGALAVVDNTTDQHLPRIVNSQPARDLLLDGQLEETDGVALRYPIWRGAVVPVAEDAEPPVDQRERADAYFMDHPDIQNAFWDNFLVDRPDGSGQRMDGYHYAQTFLTDHPEQAGAFIATIPVETLDRVSQRRLIRQAAGVVAIVQADIEPPDDQGADHAALLREQLATLTNRAGMSGMLAEELAVLENIKPGVIVLNGRMEANAKTIPSSSDFAVVHTSTAPVREQTVVQDRDTRLQLEQPEEQPDWHGLAVQAPSFEDTSRVLAHVDGQLGRTGISHSTLDLYLYGLRESGITSGKAPSVYPALLPETHPLRKLSQAGIIAVEPASDGHDFTVLVDPARAEIAVADAKLAIQGEMVEVEGERDVYLIGEENNDSESRLHKAVRGAVLLARRPVILHSLQGAELGQVRNALAGWKDREGVPKLEYRANDTKSEDNHVLFLAGKKPVLLTVKE